MSQEYAESDGQPSSIYSYSLNPISNHTLNLGWVNGQFMRDHFFMAFNAFVPAMESFNSWLKSISTQNLPADSRNGFRIPESLEVLENYHIIKQVWWGEPPYYLYQIRDKTGEIVYDELIFSQPPDKNRMSPFEDVFQFPALRHLDPKSKTKDANDPAVLLQETMPFNKMWDGYEPTQLAQIGFAFEDATGINAMFESDEEIMDAEADTLSVSREAFHIMIKKVTYKITPTVMEMMEYMRQVMYSYNFIIAMNVAERESTDSTDYTAIEED